MTIKAICMHNHMSDNRETLCVAGNSWLPVDVDNREKFCDDKRVCVHFNVSDNRETMFDAETSCLPDYAVLHVDESDNRESVCDEKAYSREYSRER